MESENSSELKKIADELKNIILDFNSNLTFSNNIICLYLEIGKNVNSECDNPINEVLNMFFVNMFNGFKSLLLLVENKCIENAFVIARRITEIFIRNEYLNKTNNYINYYNEKYIEQASLLQALIKGNEVKYIIKNPLWLDRKNILKKNKELYTKIHVDKAVKPIPSIEEMAKETGLSYLYKITYSAWSKVVHCNMSSEGFVRYKKNGKLRYNFPEDSLFQYRQGSVRAMLACTNQCMFQFVQMFCSKNNICKNIIQKFREDNIVLVSFDLYTGKYPSVNSISENMMESVSGEKVSFDDIEKVEVFHNDANAFKRNNESLEQLIEKTENLIKSLK